MRTNANAVERTSPLPDLPAMQLGEGPKRLALYRALRGLIEEGRLGPGARLPTTRELAARFSISRGATVAAFEMLVADGFAETRVGAGTFVAQAAPRLSPPAPPKQEAPPLPVLPGSPGAASPDARTMEALRKLVGRHLARADWGTLQYGSPRGDAGLREEIAAYLRLARGLRCTADRIFLTSGSQQGIDFALRIALSPGDTVWVEDPGYPAAKAALRHAGMRLAGAPVDAEGIDVDAARACAPQARAAYVTPSHQFPLGVTMTLRRRMALLDWARESDAWVIEDDYDSEFRYSGAPLTALQGIDDAERVIYLGTLSKVLFPSLRIGYMVLPDALVEPMLSLRGIVDRQPPALLEPALADFLREGHFAAHLRRARRRARAARDALVEVLDTALSPAGLAPQAPTQGLHLTCRLPEGIDDVALTQHMVARGFGARALSPMHVGAPSPRAPLEGRLRGVQPGLVIGFSGFTPEVMRQAALPLVDILRDGAQNLTRA